MNPLRWYLAALVTIALILIVTGNAFAQSPRIDTLTPEQRLQQNEADLRFFKKEIARLQYTEFCATVQLPPKPVVDMVKAAADAGDAGAQALFMWIYRIMEAYAKAGCGDA